MTGIKNGRGEHRRVHPNAAHHHRVGAHIEVTGHVTKHVTHRERARDVARAVATNVHAQPRERPVHIERIEPPAHNPAKGQRSGQRVGRKRLDLRSGRSAKIPPQSPKRVDVERDRERVAAQRAGEPEHTPSTERSGIAVHPQSIHEQDATIEAGSRGTMRDPQAVHLRPAEA